MDAVDYWGYLGVFITTALEYGCFPISSEILLPFIGFCVYRGNMDIIYAVIAATAGAGVGCTFCFYTGRIGKKFILKCLGRFKTVRDGIETASEKFNKYGAFSVFLLRMFPIARTYISFPAGMSKMSYIEFIIYTLAGSFVWNCLLISSGYLLGEYWSYVYGFIKNNEIIFSIAIFFIIIFIGAKLISKIILNIKK